MTTDKSWVRILIYNDCGTEKFLNLFFPVYLQYPVSDKSSSEKNMAAVCSRISLFMLALISLQVKLFGIKTNL